jgi:hypothetical protein
MRRFRDRVRQNPGISRLRFGTGFGRGRGFAGPGSPENPPRRPRRSEIPRERRKRNARGAVGSVLTARRSRADFRLREIFGAASQNSPVFAPDGIPNRIPNRTPDTGPERDPAPGEFGGLTRTQSRGRRLPPQDLPILTGPSGPSGSRPRLPLSGPDPVLFRGRPPFRDRSRFFCYNLLAWPRSCPGVQRARPRFSAGRDGFSPLSHHRRERLLPWPHAEN